jgi:hypothetical protein
MKTIIIAAAALAAVACGPAIAQDSHDIARQQAMAAEARLDAKKADMAFKVFNGTSFNIVDVRMIKADNSAVNILKTPIGPGQFRSIVFKTGESRCRQQTRVTLVSGLTWNKMIDYCGGKNILYVTRDDMWIE